MTAAVVGAVVAGIPAIMAVRAKAMAAATTVATMVGGEAIAAAMVAKGRW